MSTKTIAVDSRVYDKLAKLKTGSISFSKLIDNLVDQAHTSHTVAGVLSKLDVAPPLSSKDARAMEGIVKKNRDGENWEAFDLS
jgi:predicted CopG family antitoxin